MRFGHALGCHQMHSRSFFLRGYQFPVCARCTGIYLGNILGIVCLICSSFAVPFYVMIVMFLIMFLDGTAQIIIPDYQSNNRRRLITGLLFGIAMIYFLKYVVFKLFSL